MDETIRRSIGLPAPPDVVWSAITSSAELAAWFGADADVEARRGDAVRFRWRDGSERRGVVESAEAPTRFAFRWREITRLKAGVRIGEVSRVEFTLEPSPDGGTLLTVTEAPGFAQTDAIARTTHGVATRPPDDPRILASG